MVSGCCLAKQVNVKDCSRSGQPSERGRLNNDDIDDNDDDNNNNNTHMITLVDEFW